MRKNRPRISDQMKTRPEDGRDPVPADERFLRACGVRPPDVRDDLKVLDS
jgi:hypothetical protein